jgi:DNA-binding NarL/FixJ family response regulator
MSLINRRKYLERVAILRDRMREDRSNDELHELLLAMHREGKGNATIARELHWSVSTVKRRRIEVGLRHWPNE